MSIIHAAKCHVTAQLGDSDRRIRGLSRNQLLSLQLNSHGSDVFNESLGEKTHILVRLF